MLPKIMRSAIKLIELSQVLWLENSRESNILKGWGQARQLIDCESPYINVQHDEIIKNVNSVN